MPRGSSIDWCSRTSRAARWHATRTTPIPDDADRFYPIDGDYFVIRYSEVITLNVHYVKFEPADFDEVYEVDEAPDVPA